MVQKRFVAVLVLTAFGLTACPIDVIDVPTQEYPRIEISSTETQTGNPVRIDLSVTWSNGTLRDQALQEQRLGIYFCEAFIELEEGCAGEVNPNEFASVVLLSGQTFTKTFSEGIIKSGQNITLTHSFTFTSTEPLVLNPVVFVSFPPYTVGDYSGIYRGEQITFRSQ